MAEAFAVDRICAYIWQAKLLVQSPSVMTKDEYTTVVCSVSDRRRKRVYPRGFWPQLGYTLGGRRGEPRLTRPRRGNRQTGRKGYKIKPQNTQNTKMSPQRDYQRTQAAAENVGKYKGLSQVKPNETTNNSSSVKHLLTIVVKHAVNAMIRVYNKGGGGLHFQKPYSMFPDGSSGRECVVVSKR